MAEAGRSSQQPRARPGGKRGLRSASWPRPEPACFPQYRHGAWSEADYNPLEAEFLKKLKAIEGVSQVRREFCGSGELDVDVDVMYGMGGGRIEAEMVG